MLCMHLHCFQHKNSWWSLRTLWVQNSCIMILSYVVQLEKRGQLIKTSTHELLNQQHEIRFTRSIPISASLLFLFRGFKQWNFNLKFHRKASSFMQASTVVYIPFVLCQGPGHSCLPVWYLYLPSLYVLIFHYHKTVLLYYPVSVWILFCIFLIFPVFNIFI